MKDTESKTAETVAEQTVKMMADAGIKRVYAITGDSLNGINDAIRRDGRIQWIHMRHEESGAFAASAEAQLTGKLACCAGSSGPGHVHLINGLYDAQRSNAPVLALASMSISSEQGTGYFQETNPTLLFSDCNVYNQIADTPAQLPHMLQAAMQTASARGGVGIVGIPGDLTGQAAATPVASTSLLQTQELPAPDPEKVKAAADLINAAKTVTIYVGSGVIAAHDLMLSLSEKLNAPVASTYKSRLESKRDCPNFLGHMAFMGTWAAIDAVQNADVCILLGMNFPYPGFFPEHKKVIQVDIRAERLGRKCPVDVGVRADVRKFLEALLPLVEPKTDRSFLDEHLGYLKEIEEKLQLPVKNPGTKDKIRPEFVTYLIDKYADDNAVFSVDTGMNNTWTAHYLNPGKDRKMVGSFSHGSMANAMPMAIGASLACPDRQIISLSGDGGISMLMGDMMTIAQYQLPVKIVVYDNRSLAFVQWEMETAGLQPWQVNMVNPDFADVAKAMGYQAETVSDPTEVEEAVKRLLAAKGPALLAVKTDADAASFTFSKEMMENAAPGNVKSNFRPLGD